jgi:hypothetical protein
MHRQLRNGQAVVFALAAYVFCSEPLHAQIDFTAPDENSSLTRSTVLTGNCTGSQNVVLNGPGIGRNKTISCQTHNEGRYWAYPLKNVFKDMPPGPVVVTAAQGTQLAQRTFLKPSVTAAGDPPPAACYLNGITVQSGGGITAWRTATVPAGQTCASERRICTNGTLSGSFAYPACRIGQAPPAPVPTSGGLVAAPPPPPPAPGGSASGSSNSSPGTSGSSTPAPAPSPAPPIDRTLWKLTLPVDASGGFSGTAIEIKPLPAAYERAPYFYTVNEGALTFMAPTEGATTSGSHYPRSELREMTGAGTEAAWTIAQGGTLSATLAVNELPLASGGKNGRIVIGQIHGPSDELCRLYYDNGKLHFHDDKSGPGQTELEYVLRSPAGAVTSIPLNASFDYSIVVANGTLTVSAQYAGTTYTASETINAFWKGKALYFKAGAYVQVGKPGSGAGTTGTGRGRVSFYRLTPPSHP